MGGGGEPFSVRAPFGPVFPFVDLYISWQHNLLIECLASFPTPFPLSHSLLLSLSLFQFSIVTANIFQRAVFSPALSAFGLILSASLCCAFRQRCLLRSASLWHLFAHNTPSPPSPALQLLCLRVSSSAKNLNWFVLYCGYVCGCLSAPVSAAAAAPTAAVAAPPSPCSP